MSALWGSSASNVFGVCHDADIVHFDGTSWYAMEHNVEPREFLKGVWGSSEKDVYAVGENSMIMHYDGSEWKSMHSGITDLGIHLYGVWGSSPSNIYAVGVAGTILHFDGLTWSDYEESGTEETLRAIWGTSSNDIYAVGDNGTIIHYDGENWSQMENGTTYWLLGVWGTSATNVYAVGGKYLGGDKWFHPDSWDGGAILHYDGNSWSEIKTDIDNRLFSIWGSPEDNIIFTVGAQNTILRYGDPLVEEKCFFENLYENNTDKLASLRNFRDGVLNTTTQGKLAISTYYAFSPYMVKIINNNRWIRRNMDNLIEIFLPSLGVVID
jgi:hypothetical protein